MMEKAKKTAVELERELAGLKLWVEDLVLKLCNRVTISVAH
jgi:hypothetical protein